MNVVPLTRMSADHVGRYSIDRNLSGNSVDPDQTLHYAPSDLGLTVITVSQGTLIEIPHKQWVMIESGELIIKFTHM